MTERGPGLETAGGQDWPVIVLPEDPELQRKLAKKADEYADRLFADTEGLPIGIILSREFADAKGGANMPRADAYLKWMFVSATLMQGECDTAELNELLHTDLRWRSEFMAVQFYDMDRFDAIAWDAARVVEQYVRGERAITMKPQHTDT